MNRDYEGENVYEYRNRQVNRPERKLVAIGNGEYSPLYLATGVFTFIAGILSVCAFSAPYWSQSYPSTGSGFKNIGLWEICFFDNRFRLWMDDYQRPFSGCFWIWSPYIARFRDWILAPWFVAVQWFACFGLILTILALVLLAVSFLTKIRFKFGFVFPLSILLFADVVMMFLTLIIYGLGSDNRYWMPRPEYNVLSWCYWFQLASCILLFISFLMSLAEARILYAKRNQREETIVYAGRELHLANPQELRRLYR